MLTEITATTADISFSFFGLEQREQTINQSNHEYQVENIKAHTYSAIGGSGCIITGKESKGKAVLVESHPEEDHYGEYQYESGNAGFGLFRS